MADEVIIPYKAKYTFKEVWDELKQTAGYKQYVISNPIESAKLIEIAQLKIKVAYYEMPLGIAKTHMGMLIVMLINTLSQPVT